MSERAEALKDKLETVIDKFIKVTRQRRTHAIKAIAKQLNVLPRQVYKWISMETYPSNAETIGIILDEIARDFENTKPPQQSQITPQPTISNGASFQLQMKISKQTLKISQDANGNIIVNGYFSMNLL